MLTRTTRILVARTLADSYPCYWHATPPSLIALTLTVTNNALTLTCITLQTCLIVLKTTIDIHMSWIRIALHGLTP